MPLFRLAFIGLYSALFGLVSELASGATIYSDRVSFLGAVGASLTDGYTSYPNISVRTDAEMNAVFGQTRYTAITFPNQNQVGPIYAYGDGSNYGSGINGNFRLGFDSTSFSQIGGVFGVGFDIVFHTSRRTSLGDGVPGQGTLPGTIEVKYTDGNADLLTIPADIGFFAPQIYFVGLTDPRGIASITIGTEPTAFRHSWAIDNLTIGGHVVAVPEPSGLLACVVVILAGISSFRNRFHLSPATRSIAPDAD